MGHKGDEHEASLFGQEFFPSLESSGKFVDLSINNISVAKLFKNR